jgi:hypothetical protein
MRTTWRTAIEGAYVPPAAVIGEREGRDFASSQPAGERAVRDLDRRLAKDGPCDNGQRFQVGVADLGRGLRRNQWSMPHGLVVAVALRQPCQHASWAEVKEWAEPRRPDVDLVLAVVVDVARDQVFVTGQITRRGGRLDAEAGDQVLPPNLAEEPHAQFNERQPVALGLGELFNQCGHDFCWAVCAAERYAGLSASYRIRKGLHASRFDDMIRRMTISGHHSSSAVR